MVLDKQSMMVPMHAARLRRNVFVFVAVGAAPACRVRKRVFKRKPKSTEPMRKS